MKKKHREAMIAMGIKIAGLEEIVHRHTLVFGAQRTRLSELDEELDCLKHGANPAGQDLLQRVTALEGILNNTPFSSVLMKELVNRVTALEGDRHTFLPHQHVGVEDRIKVLEQAVKETQKTEGKIIDIAGRREILVETIQQQVKEINSRLTNLVDRVLMFEDIYKAHNHDGNVKEPRSPPKKHPPISTEFGLAKKQPKSGLEWGMGTAPPTPDTPQVNLFAVKKGRPRKVK